MRIKIAAIFLVFGLSACEIVPDPEGAVQDVSETPVVNYQAYGTEPFWSLRIEEKRLVFEPMDGAAVIAQAYEARPSLNGWRYISPNMTIDVTHTDCSDGMSDNIWQDTVTVMMDEKTWRGCGGEKMTPELTGTGWSIFSINGEEPAVGQTGNRSARLQFSGGSVAGSVGCNVFGGEYLAGAGWIYVPMLISTQMSCGGKLDEQEGIVTDILSGRSLLSVRDEGELVIDNGRYAMALSRSDCHDCEKAVHTPTRSIEGAWSIQMIDGEQVGVENADRYQLSLKDGLYTAVAGCNAIGMNSGYSLDGDKLILQPAMMTKMACAGKAGEDERRFLEIIAQPLRYRVTANDQLLLANEIGGLYLTPKDGPRGGK